MSLARNLSKFKPSSSGLVETADIADDAVSTDQIANNATINTSGAITTTGAFTSQGIDDNADATAITITSDEAVGIGKSLTPNNYSGYQSLTIGGSDATTGATVDLEDSSGNLEGRINGTNGIVYIEADPNGSTGASKISLEVDGSAKMTVLDGGDVNIANGNLVIGTSGKGIDFSATGDTSATGASDTSELLSDYEEGTWTPYFLTGHSYGPSYAEQYGRYVRIGNQITCQYWIRMAADLHSNGSAVRIAGLPYVLGKTGSENPDSYARGLGSTGYQDYNTNDPSPYGDNGLSTFSLHYNSNQAWSFGSNGSVHGSSGNGKYFIGGITYTVDM